MNEYRIVEGIGPYFNKRYEVQKRYSYYENGNKILAWKLVFASINKNECMEVLHKYMTEPQKDYRLPFTEEILALWN